LLTLEAIITQFITVPYVEHELADMKEKMRRRIQNFDLEKVLDERDVARIDAENKNDLRRQIMRVYKQYHPNPIVVYTDAFEVYSFISRWRYRSWLPWTLGEVVFFQGIDNKSDGTTTGRHLVLGRIIGKDQRARHRYQWYFTDRHKFEGQFSSDFNSPNDFNSSWG
jgi:hypothetical protein